MTPLGGCIRLFLKKSFLISVLTKKIPNGAENVFLSIVQVVTEVLYKSHFSLQMENFPIPVAEHSGHWYAIDQCNTRIYILMSRWRDTREDWNNAHSKLLSPSSCDTICARTLLFSWCTCSCTSVLPALLVSRKWKSSVLTENAIRTYCLTLILWQYLTLATNSKFDAVLSK